jgi:hypothetical protein
MLAFEVRSAAWIGVDLSNHLATDGFGFVAHDFFLSAGWRQSDFNGVVGLDLAAALRTTIVAHAIPLVGPLGATLAAFVEVPVKRLDFFDRCVLHRAVPFV